MECLEAQAILSAAHDGESIEPADLQAANDHCAECDDCAAFEAGLRYVDLIPAPSAPAGLVANVMATVTALASERAEAERMEAERLEAERAQAEAVAELLAAAPPVETPAAPRFAWFAGPTKWATLGAVGAVAATALVAFIIFGSGTGARTASETAGTASSTAGAPDLTFSGGTQPKTGQTPAPVTPTNPAPATAPDYVDYKGLVYAPGALLADSSSATPTIGTVTTAFASAGAPAKADVYKSPLTDGSIVVKGPDGIRVYTPVVRLMASNRYQLASGNSIDRFGIWPTLPARFTRPTSADGSPSFTAAGSDANGVPVYAATGQPVTQGFAIAPGTSSTDAAGGNPNWTWWEPVTVQ
jgi:hypothetical protein